MILLWGKKEKTFQNAMDLFIKNKYKQTIRVCDEILEKSPNNLEVLNLMGDASFLLGDKEKALSIYSDLLNKLEKGNYYDKAIALVKKIVRQYPDLPDYQIKVAELYGHKELFREQIEVLFELIKEHKKKGSARVVDRIVGILSKLNPVSSSDTAALIKILNDYGTSQDVQDMAEKGLALKDVNLPDLMLFIDFAIEKGSDISLYVKRLPVYIKNAPEKLQLISDKLCNYFVENKEPEFFKQIINSADLSLFLPMLNCLKRRKPSAEVYRLLMENAANTGDNATFEELLNEVAAINENVLDYSYAKACHSLMNHMKTTAALENLCDIVRKTHADDLKQDALIQLLNAYEKEGNAEKAQAIEDEIAGKVPHGKLIGAEIAAGNITVDSFDHTDIPEINDILEYSLMDSMPLNDKSAPEAPVKTDNVVNESEIDEDGSVEEIDLETFTSDSDETHDTYSPDHDLFEQDDTSDSGTIHLLDLDRFAETPSANNDENRFNFIDLEHTNKDEHNVETDYLSHFAGTEGHPSPTNKKQPDSVTIPDIKAELADDFNIVKTDIKEEPNEDLKVENAPEVKAGTAEDFDSVTVPEVKKEPTENILVGSIFADPEKNDEIEALTPPIITKMNIKTFIEEPKHNKPVAFEDTIEAGEIALDDLDFENFEPFYEESSNTKSNDKPNASNALNEQLDENEK